MPEQTTNYNLIKQLPLEFYDRTLDNQNLDTIDALIKALQDAKANGTDLTQLREQFTQHKDKNANAHGATSAATPNRIISRDAAGRAKVAAPSADDEIALLGTVKTLIANLVNNSPATLDTLDELAQALGDDPNFATTITNLIGQKYTKPVGGIPESDFTLPVQNTLRKADDTGRYQGEFGWDGVVYSNCSLLNNNVVLTSVDSVSLNKVLNTNGGSASAESGVILRPTVTISELTVVINSNVTATRLKVVNHSTGAELYTATISAKTATISVNLQAGVNYRILVDSGGSSYNSYLLNSNTFPYSTSQFSVTSGYWAGAVNNYNYYAFDTITTKSTVEKTSGTATKIVNPSDVKKWGNLKFDKVTPANTNVVVDVLSITDAVLKPNIQSLQDLSDINPLTYPLIKLRFTLSRTSTSVTSPTVSNISVTWEGPKDFTTLVKTTSGTYTGNGSLVRTISIGFTPKVVHVIQKSSDANPRMESYYFDENYVGNYGIANDATPSSGSHITVKQGINQTNNLAVGKIVEGGFVVQTDGSYLYGMNVNGKNYAYVAIG